MNFLYTTPQGFVHAVRYRDAMIRAWCKRTGRMDKSGGCTYDQADLPAYYDVPTNEERSHAECLLFSVVEPMTRGSRSWLAYLSNDRRITTWMGETLANVTRLTSYRVVRGALTDSRGSFWAIGIDGRTYYGTHNGTGMYCRMRLAMYRTDYDVQQYTPSYGWETVTIENTWRKARQTLQTYQENEPGLYRIKREKVEQ
jgi:hypothetical protein